MQNSNKLIITHRDTAQFCCVRLRSSDKQLQLRDEKTSMNYTGLGHYKIGCKMGATLKCEKKKVLQVIDLQDSSFALQDGLALGDEGDAFVMEWRKNQRPPD